MLDEISLHKMQEDEEFGLWLIETIGEIYGTNQIPLIKKKVFKYTLCGAWVEFDEQGIIVGTIVEGSPAEYSERISLRNIDPDNNGTEELKKRFLQALQNCENFAEEHFGDTQ